jgi:hypothetical protein
MNLVLQAGVLRLPPITIRALGAPLQMYHTAGFGCFVSHPFVRGLVSVRDLKFNSGPANRDADDVLSAAMTGPIITANRCHAGGHAFESTSGKQTIQRFQGGCNFCQVILFITIPSKTQLASNLGVLLVIPRTIAAAPSVRSCEFVPCKSSSHRLAPSRVLFFSFHVVFRDGDDTCREVRQSLHWCFTRDVDSHAAALV